MINRAISSAFTHLILQQPDEKLGLGIASQWPKPFPFMPAAIPRWHFPASLVRSGGHGTEPLSGVHRNILQEFSTLLPLPQQTCGGGRATDERGFSL